MNYFNSLTQNLFISGDINREMIVTDVTKYYDKLGINYDDDAIYDSPEFNMIERIINFQVAGYLLRRLPGGSNGVAEWFIKESALLINEFELQFSKPFEDFNTDIDW